MSVALPVHVVEDHDEALPYIYRAIDLLSPDINVRCFTRYILFIDHKLH